jgi:hypothetical protein
MFFKYIKLSKIQNLDKHGNKKLVVLMYFLLVAKLSIKILTMALLSFCHYSSDPSWAFTIKSIKMTLITTYVSTRLAFQTSAFVGFCSILSLSKSPLPKSHSF